MGSSLRNAWLSVASPGSGIWPSTKRSATIGLARVFTTTGGLSKLEIYRRFNVPEVWFWRRQALEIFALRYDGAACEPVSRSRLLPDLDVALLERCVVIRSWQQARRTFRAGFSGSH